ncbi:restriction endonuclease subunit S [Vibrio vulnificus]|uniref:restriction endonuclease subunit S n=1 Tax=Vibrio vulnificus TaxID=672 RepID=UPI00397F9866
MSVDWPEFQLSEKCTIKSSTRIFKKEYVETGVPFMRSKDVIDKALGVFSHFELFISKERFQEIKNKYGFPKKGDLLISSVGNRSGWPYIVQDEGDFYFKDGNVIWMSEFDDLDPDFLAYWMKSDIGQSALASIMIGSAQKAITIDSLRKLWVRFPPFEYQQRSSDILKLLDKQIAGNKATNQTLEQIAQAIFKSWFVDFDPVKAKIEALAAGGSADDAELAAMSVISAKTVDELNSLKASSPEAFNKLAQTATLFPATMQDSELGEIPEGWSVEQLGDHLNVLQTGSRPKGGVGGITEGVPSVGAENILGVGKYTYGKEKFVSREFFDKLKRGVVEDFDFLLYKDGGKPGEFKPRVSMFGCGFPYSEFAINEHVFRMRSESLGQAFLYFQIGHKRVLDELANRGGKAAIPGINQTDVKTIPVLVPGAADLLTEFNEFAQKIIESILKKSNESNHLVSIRDTLLPKLLNGEIDLTSEVVA